MENTGNLLPVWFQVTFQALLLVCPPRPHPHPEAGLGRGNDCLEEAILILEGFLHNGKNVHQKGIDTDNWVFN
jgi:hypothetical protein